MSDVPALTEAQQRTFDAVNRVEVDGRQGWLHEIAEEAGVSLEEVREALSGLLDEHDLVQEVDTPDEAGEDLGPRYRVKQRP